MLVPFKHNEEDVDIVLWEDDPNDRRVGVTIGCIFDSLEAEFDAADIGSSTSVAPAEDSISMESRSELVLFTSDCSRMVSATSTSLPSTETWREHSFFTGDGSGELRRLKPHGRFSWVEATLRVSTGLITVGNATRTPGRKMLVEVFSVVP